MTGATSEEAAVRKWIVARTQPHREPVALSNLAAQGLDVYCPMIRKRVRHARRTQDVPRPLFPSYVFVSVAKPFAEWRPVLSTRGVQYVVRFGDKFGYVADAFVQSLKACESDGFIVRPESHFKVGQSVQVVTGPFDGLVVRIIEMNEKDRLVVLMNVLGGPQRVHVTSDQIAQVQAS